MFRTVSKRSARTAKGCHGRQEIRARWAANQRKNDAGMGRYWLLARPVATAEGMEVKKPEHDSQSLSDFGSGGCAAAAGPGPSHSACASVCHGRGELEEGELPVAGVEGVVEDGPKEHVHASIDQYEWTMRDATYVAEMIQGYQRFKAEEGMP